jgi:hypothetical protein
VPSYLAEGRPAGVSSVPGLSDQDAISIACPLSCRPDFTRRTSTTSALAGRCHGLGSRLAGTARRCGAGAVWPVCLAGESRSLPLSRTESETTSNCAGWLCLRRFDGAEVTLIGLYASGGLSPGGEYTGCAHKHATSSQKPHQSEKMGMGKRQSIGLGLKTENEDSVV